MEDSKGNGLAERAVRSLQEMIRVHKLSFESRLKTKLPCAHPLMAWLVEQCVDVSGEVHGGVMQERWFPGIWLGKKLHSEEHLVMKEDGLVVRSRAVRENSQPLVMGDCDKLISTPHDPTGTVKAATTRTVLPDVHAQE